MSIPLLLLSITYEHDVVLARQRTRQVAEVLGFDAQDQTRLATAVSEIARNAFTYANDGKVQFWVEGRTAPQVLLISIKDTGPGIADLDSVLRGTYRSPTGMGIGLLGAKRLMDQFNVESGPRGTTVVLKKILPRGRPVITPGSIAAMVKQLTDQPPQNAFEELQRQNQELLRTLDELRKRQDDLARLNSELQDTNRGVVALYAELEEKADHLRRADEVKTKFLSNMSHEFRTPLNSILGLSQLMLDGSDGPLTDEQQRQVGFIRKSADDLLELVNDLLDLAKIEAGKTTVRPAEFRVRDLFSALRGMLRPLLVNESLTLVFEAADEVPPLYQDERKVSQILRNFLSNAIKFTERGEVRVSARPSPDGRTVTFSVTDTGIGIAPEHQGLIFKEFEQVEHHLQRKVKGTGLGLPLSQRLAVLLRGDITLASEPGRGSTFSLTIPVRYQSPEEPTPVVIPSAGTTAHVVLIVEDEDEVHYLYQRYLDGTAFHPVSVQTLKAAREVLSRLQPAAIVLDILLWEQDTWGFLAELKADPATAHIPVLIASTVEDAHKSHALGADGHVLKPVDRDTLLDRLTRFTAGASRTRVLVVDDDPTFRYLLRKLLPVSSVDIMEAESGEAALQVLAGTNKPSLILLDLTMPGMSGFDLFERLHSNAGTREIPVIMISSKELDAEEKRWMTTHGVTFLPKDGLSGSVLTAAVQEAVRYHATRAA